MRAIIRLRSINELLFDAITLLVFLTLLWGAWLFGRTPATGQRLGPAEWRAATEVRLDAIGADSVRAVAAIERLRADTERRIDLQAQQILVLKEAVDQARGGVLLLSLVATALGVLQLASRFGRKGNGGS